MWHPEFLFNEMDLLRPLGTLPRVNHRDLLVDVKETDKDVSITADVPGISKDNVHARAKHGVVTISVTEESEKKDEKKDDAGNVVAFAGEEQEFRLPLDPDAENGRPEGCEGVSRRRRADVDGPEARGERREGRRRDDPDQLTVSQTCCCSIVGRHASSYYLIYESVLHL